MPVIQSKPISRELGEAKRAITIHPALSITAVALLAGASALLIAMYPEMKRYLLAKRM